MMTDTQPKTELFCIRARKAPTAVIFRRGPSKQVLLIKWNLGNDTFELGQWFKGRIYERRCDLLPSGEKLLYFAAHWKQHKSPWSWSAVSKPPYLSALAMWPNRAGWGGGGLFDSEFTLSLNHGTHAHQNNMGLAEGFQLGKDMNVRTFEEESGQVGEEPIHHARLLREGWVVIDEGKCEAPNQHAKVVWAYQEPRIYAKKCPQGKNGLVLQMQIKGRGEKDASWYHIDHALVTQDGNAILMLPRTSWADWDNNGDLLFARGGALFRLPYAKQIENFAVDKAKEIADFSTLKFEEKMPPKEALTW